jgi:hypothetical protein
MELLPLLGFIMIFGLALLELIFIAVFFILLVVGASLDRRGNEAPKWYILGIGLAIVAFWFWPHFTFFGPAEVAAVMNGTKVVSEAQTRVVLWDVISNWSFWTPLWMFLGVGVVYSIVEFVLEVRRSARQYSKQWADWLSSRADVKQLDAKGDQRSEETANGRKQWVTKTLTMREVLADLEDKSNAAYATEAVESFVGRNPTRYGFVELTLNEARTAPEPRINKFQLSRAVGAWTFMWPVYAVSLVLGDLLTEIFNWIADILVNLSSRFVRMSFSDVFKF